MQMPNSAAEPADKRPDPGTASPEWERNMITRLAFAALREQRATRRWGLVFKLLVLVYLIALLFVVSPGWLNFLIGNIEPHTAVIDINGVIADDSDASADRIASALNAALKDTNTVGVILRINSPGGSPVQAGYIYDEIKRLREKYPAIPIYAVVADICASGGYYIAAAADKIYVDKASLIGSIGVLISSFGFVETLEKLGIERRLYTAGEHKGFLDPFSPSRPGDTAHIETLLQNIHNQFINAVRTGRGDRLKETDYPNLYSGWVWTGEQAVEMGLADGLGSTGYVAREIFGAEHIANYTRRPYLERLMNRFSTQMQSAVTEHLQGQLPVLK